MLKYPMLKYLVGVTIASALTLTSVALAVGSANTVGNGSSLATSSGASAASAGCSKATAVQVVERLGMSDPGIPDPSHRVGQVLCGAFLGAGSQAMVATIANGTCWPTSGWAVFRYTGGAWKLAPNGWHSGFVVALAAVGSDIRETVPVYRKGDGPCNPTGGTKARIWHWNGSRLGAGPWKQVTPGSTPAPVAAFKYGYFKTPSGNIQCDYGYGGNSGAYVRCGIRSGLKPAPPSRGPGCFQAPWLALGPSGRAQLGPSTCPGEDAPDAGPFAGGQPGGPPVAVLQYGKTWSGGGLRCTSALAGLTCRNKSGHGFFLSRERWRSF